MMAANATDAGEPRTRHHGRGHLPALDGLRGAAVLGVMATHLVTGDLSGISFNGLFAARVCLEGVDLFFVLSGFLISGILLDSLGDGGYFRKFYARRALRIFPLYYGVLLLALLLTKPLEVRWNGTWPSFLLYLQNLRVMPAVWQMPPQRYLQFTHLWTLAIEEQFYLVWPLVLWLARGRRRVLGACTLGVAVAAGVRWWMYRTHVDVNVVNANTLCRMDQLLLGAALVVVLRSGAGAAVCRAAGPAFCAGAVTEYAIEWAGFHGRLPARAAMASLHYLEIGLLAAALLAWCVQPGSLANRAFQWKPLRFFGKYSYGLYVLHAVALPAFYGVLLWLRAHGVGRLQARGTMAVVEFCTAVLAAYASFHLYEKQFLRLKRYFDYQRESEAG